LLSGAFVRSRRAFGLQLLESLSGLGFPLFDKCGETNSAISRDLNARCGAANSMSPVLATLPAMNVNVPLERVNNVEFAFPFGLYTNSFNSMRALLERLNAVPSLKVIPTALSAPVETTSLL
jgi:hypothetical protein